MQKKTIPRPSFFVKGFAVTRVIMLLRDITTDSVIYLVFFIYLYVKIQQQVVNCSRNTKYSRTCLFDNDAWKHTLRDEQTITDQSWGEVNADQHTLMASYNREPFVADRQTHDGRKMSPTIHWQHEGKEKEKKGQQKCWKCKSKTSTWKKKNLMANIYGWNDWRWPNNENLSRVWHSVRRRNVSELLPICISIFELDYQRRTPPTSKHKRRR